jgi:hypothetical protein
LFYTQFNTVNLGAQTQIKIVPLTCTNCFDAQYYVANMIWVFGTDQNFNPAYVAAGYECCYLHISGGADLDNEYYFESQKWGPTQTLENNPIGPFVTTDNGSDMNITIDAPNGTARVFIPEMSAPGTYGGGFNLSSTYWRIGAVVNAKSNFVIDCPNAVFHKNAYDDPNIFWTPVTTNPVPLTDAGNGAPPPSGSWFATPSQAPSQGGIFVTNCTGS